MAGDGDTNLYEVDWAQIPEPIDDGAARHLVGLRIPDDIGLVGTDGSVLALGELPGRTVLYVYPYTGVPGKPLPADDWDSIPGARGCTPQACAFRDHYAELQKAGADHVFGLSTQDIDYQGEAVRRLHLPFSLLSDRELQLAQALGLPMMVVGQKTLIKRITLVIDDGIVRHVFYPVFPPDEDPKNVLLWLEQNPK